MHCTLQQRLPFMRVKGARAIGHTISQGVGSLPTPSLCVILVLHIVDPRRGRRASVRRALRARAETGPRVEHKYRSLFSRCITVCFKPNNVYSKKYWSLQFFQTSVTLKRRDILCMHILKSLNLQEICLFYIVFLRVYFRFKVTDI